MRLFMVVPITIGGRDRPWRPEILLSYCQHCLFAVVVGTGEQFFGGDVDTGDKMLPGVVDTGQK
jgi:hypothetical protein